MNAYIKEHITVVILLISASVIIIFLSFSHRGKAISEPYSSYEGLKDVIIIYKEANDPKDIISVECIAVLPVVYKKVPVLDSLPVDKKKEKFIDIVLPSILIANFRILQKREKVIKIRKKLENGEVLTYSEERFLSEILREYKSNSIDDLLKKLNAVPVSLALAQAAIESGWGSSRFFVKGNNVYGMWTFKKKIKNKMKAKGNNVYLKTYPDILSSVEDYLYSINVSWAYEKFRLVRLRSTDPLLLSNHLEKYSTLRKKYVRRIKIVIKENKLYRYDKCKIHPDYIY